MPSLQTYSSKARDSSTECLRYVTRAFGDLLVSDEMRRLPRYGWIGVFVIALSEAGMLARIEPFYHWHTPIAWTGYILLADAVVWKRRGSSWLRNNPAELFFLACASVPLWVIFEMYNKFVIHNWYYAGLPDDLLLRYFGYVWSFATIWPAMFETGDLISSLRDRRAPANRADEPLPHPLRTAGWICVAAGVLMLAVPILLRGTPLATYLAAPVWLGFILLLDPLNARAGGESLLGGLARGAHGAGDQPARGRAGLRAPVGILELLVGRQMGLQRADPARREDLRDADCRLRGLSRLRAGMLRDVRGGPAMGVARRGAPDLDIIRLCACGKRRSSSRTGECARSATLEVRPTRYSASRRWFTTGAQTMNTVILEREIKLEFGSVDEARQAVIAAGGTPLLGRRLQEDSLLDTADDQFHRRRCILRVRVENGKSRLTFKGPVQPSIMKVREELETVVGDGEVLLRVFEELGLHVWFRYQKYREEFSHEDVIVAVDETPVGVYVEIEGSEQGIADMAAALGRTQADYIVDSYQALFLQRRDALGMSGPDMVFDGSA